MKSSERFVRFCVVFGAFFVSLQTQASVSIISDLDDTIKITNAGSAVEASVNGAFTTSVYTGMEEFLIESRAEKDEDKTHVVTASPLFLRSRVNSLLRKHGIIADSVSLRNVVKEKTPEFKKRIIRKILSESADDFILIGDDVNEDHLIYDELSKEYPERIQSIYIHVVKGRVLPPTAVPYWTAFDISLREHLAGRLPLTSVSKVASKILAQKKNQRIIPRFAHCPTERALWDWHKETAAAELGEKVTDKVLGHCLKRRSKK